MACSRNSRSSTCRFLWTTSISAATDATAGIHIPEAGVGLISGGIRNEEQLRIAEKMRRQCGIIVAFGTCAAYGGIPALMNLFEDKDLFQRYYRNAEGTDAAPNPSQVIPPFLDRTFALDEKIAVDFHPAGLSAASGPHHRRPGIYHRWANPLNGLFIAFAIPVRQSARGKAGSRGFEDSFETSRYQPAQAGFRDALPSRAGISVHGAGHGWPGAPE